MKSLYSSFRQEIMAPFLVIIVGFVFLGLAGNVMTAQESKTSGKDWEKFDPNNFDESSTTIDNKWLPLKVGRHWVFKGSTNEDGERVSHRIEFTVTDLTKVIKGVRTVVVWIVDYGKGELVEKEIAFFAQGKDGTVWYFGEYPEAYEDGELVEAPAWIAGIEDARPGIAMKAKPKAGAPSYSQGWAPAVDWTDRAQVYKMGEKTSVPAGDYDDVLVMDEFNYKEPGFKLKYYAPGVGNVRVGWRGEDEGQEILELTKFVELDAKALGQIRKQALALETDAYEQSKDVYAKTQPAERTIDAND